AQKVHSSRKPARNRWRIKAEGGRFELPRACALAVFKTAALNLARPPLPWGPRVSQHSRAALPPASPPGTSLQADCHAPTPARTMRNLTEAEPRPHAAPPRCDGWWTRRNDPLLTSQRCASRPCRSSGSLPAPTTWPPRKPDHALLGPDPALQRDRAGQP